MICVMFDVRLFTAYWLFYLCKIVLIILIDIKSSTLLQTLGSNGTVVDVLPNGCARVVVSESSWTYNVDALKVIARCGK